MKQKQMSIRPFPQSIINSPSLQNSQVTRSPNKKLSTYLKQNTVDSNQSVNQLFVRSNLKQKHKTFAAIDFKNKQKYKLANVEERKVFLLLGLAQQFIQHHENKRYSYQQTLKKKRHDRRKMFNLTSSSSQFKVIEPLNGVSQQQQDAYNFFVNVRNFIKDSYRQKFLQEMKKSTKNLDQIIPKRVSTKELTPIHKSRSSINVSQVLNEKSLPATFITTGEFNKTSQSGSSFQQGELMNVTQFPQEMKSLIRNVKSQGKFHILKLKSHRSRLRIHPVANRYESRKKQEIRTFMQLNEKTQHLQNFRSQQGKFFKFNENLKISVKGVNICRVTLLSKRRMLMRQLERLGDEEYFKEQNKMIKSIRESYINSRNSQSQQRSTSISKQQPKTQHQTTPSSSFSTTQVSFTQYKQKAIRVMGYFQQTIKYFTEIQSFLYQFLKSDNCYLNYLHQNQIKQKLKANQKQTQAQKFYDDFVDACFHMSQITRIYFNILNQLTHFNHSVHEFKFLTKQSLQIMTKTVLELRYVIIYLQKQCENTTQSSVKFIHYRDEKKDGQNDNNGKVQNNNNGEMYKTIYNNSKQAPSQRQKLPQVQKKLVNNQPLVRASPNNQASSVLKQFANVNSVDRLKESRLLKLNKRGSKLQMATVLTSPAEETMGSPMKRTSSQTIKRSILKRKLQQQITNNNSGQQNVDLNQIWKTFYNKKFSSNAMRLRLY